MSGRLGRLGTVGVVLAGCLLVGTALGGCGSGSSGPSTAVGPPAPFAEPPQLAVHHADDHQADPDNERTECRR